ncbi:MAG: VanW family protein [Clostridiales bacterium]|jgi:vancomycin resistance protein YoaR|nr:VanW family protein [Clostridiales bacterium]
MKNYVLVSFIVLFLAFNVSCENENISNNKKQKDHKNFEQISEVEVLATEEIISEYSTKIIDKTKNRTHNIKAAAKKFEKIVVEPEETVSFNEIVGRRSQKTGFKKAKGLIGKKGTEMYGGGICQLATTVYQAAKIANLEIVERHKHQKNIAYVKAGQDATISFGKLDLKIKNNLSHKIKFLIIINPNFVKVSILKIT